LKPETTSYEREILSWRRRRIERLTAPDGWLSVTGLFWIESGEHGAGSDPSAEIRLPAGRAPWKLGTFVVSARGVVFRGPEGEVGVDAGSPEEKPVVRHGGLTLSVIERAGRFGVRVRDERSPARRTFHGIESFPIDPAWRIDGLFEAYDPARRIAMGSVLGDAQEERSTGAVLFRAGGAAQRLETILEHGEEDHWIVFGDETNGSETYGGGRFVYVRPPVAGRTVIDFNRAYNPPCVFSPYTTCPLPPPENRLTIRVEAGEKAYDG